VDLSKLTTSDRLIVGGGIVYLIAMFLPWYGYDEFGIDYSSSGWDFFLGGIIPFILIAVMVAHVLLTRFSPDTNLPDLPLPWAQVHLLAGAAAAAIVVLRLLIASDDVGDIDTNFTLDRKYGLFVALIAAIVVAVGGLQKSKESPAGSPGGGTAL
jgi:hypothetical protein